MTISGNNQRGPFLWGALFVLAFALGIGFAVVVFNYTDIFSPRGQPSDTPRTLAHIPEPVLDTPLALPIIDNTPRLAIVIDDMGQSITRLDELLSIGELISIAVLPGLKHSRLTAREASENGLEVLLHLPMEPKDMARNNPGELALLLSLNLEELRERTSAGIDDVYYMTGVNNHMGSRFTEDKGKMQEVLSVIQERGFYFLDSVTSPRSMAMEAALELGIKTGERDVFLDNVREKDAIIARLVESVEVARKNGYAIAIGHPYPETMLALGEFLPGLAAEGVRLVSVSELME
jgi:hypothetical protein